MKKDKKMKYNKLLTSFFLAGVFLLSGCGNDNANSRLKSSPPKTKPSTGVGQVLETTTIITTDGEVIRVSRTANGLIFSGHENKIVLLEIYGDSCPHCKDSIPGYNILQNKYPNDVYVITIEAYGDLDSNALREYANTYGMQYDTVAKENSGSMFSFLKSLTGYDREAVPYLTVYTRNGDLAQDIAPQGLSVPYVDSLIQELL